MVAKAGQHDGLNESKPGTKGEVSHFSNERVGSKLMAMGVLPGSQIEYIRKAPFGGGCYIKVDNFLLGLRKTEAASIVLK
ncbi:MAG: ferrous iron transport protein A [Mameliella sp.]|nr:ferrous iron transport protein A [Phaeodactylibacter sp.]NRA48716.1 ferrous iron transport protein A [Phaeodactylibacter sp.]